MQFHDHKPRRGRLSRVTFVIAIAPLAMGLVSFWLGAAMGQRYTGPGDLILLPSLDCTLVATPLAAICIFKVRDAWARLAVVAVIADWFLLMTGAM